MHPNDLKKFRDEVATPALKRLFDKTQILEGACYIDNLEVSFLDGRSCGFDSRIQASGLLYRDGKVEQYLYDELDVSLDAFFDAHKDCIFLSDGKLCVEDELEEMILDTKIRNIQACAKVFFQFENMKGINIVFSPIEFEKMKYLLQEQQTTRQGSAPPLSERISDAASQAASVRPTYFEPTKDSER